MCGLAQAENGQRMVEICANGAGIVPGQSILLDAMSPPAQQPPASFHSSNLGQPSLARHGTLLSACTTPQKHAAELKSILGNAHSKLKPGSSLTADEYTTTTLEQAKRRSREPVVLFWAHLSIPS